jgi:hypothetical protein
MPSPSEGRDPQANDCFARVDGDADVQVERRVSLVQLDNCLAHGECGADGALRIVLVRDRSPEDRHDRVADEFLHRPPETLDLGAQAPVVGREHGAHVLRIELLRSSGEADEIGEEDRDDLPLFPGDCMFRGERSSAGVAKACAFRVRLAAFAADRHVLKRTSPEGAILGRWA